MELSHVITVIVVLIGIVFLWQKRATPNSAAPPIDDKFPNTSPPAQPQSGSVADATQQAITRLIATPGYAVKADHADCKLLIAQGVDSLRAIQAQVERSAGDWVHLYAAMGAVAEGLGAAGRDTLARLLDEANDAHQDRLSSFLIYAASVMTPALCEPLCERVTTQNAETFARAAAHHGKQAVEIIINRLCAAQAPQHAEALQQLLTATFSALRSDHKKAWSRALSHDDSRVRAAVVAADHDSESRDAVLALADDAAEPVRYAFVCHVDDISAKTLLRLIKDESPRVRAVAAWTLDRDDLEDPNTFEKMLSDPHPAVALMAAISIEHPSCEERLLQALASPDVELRRCGARAASFLSPAGYGAALVKLEKAGHFDELAEAISNCEDDPAALRAIAALAMRNPPIQVLRAAEVQLAFSDDAADIAALLLAPALPARVRRAGFYSITPHRESWPRYVLPLLRLEEPLLADLIDDLEGTLNGDEPVDREMFEQLKRRYPGTPLEELANTALNKKE